MPDLLIELLSEEIPARMQRKAAGDLRKLVTDALVAAGLHYEGAKEYWTPRRLALDIRGLSAHSADISEEKKGPRVGAPEQAVQGFLRSAGLASLDQASIVSDAKKGDFYVAVIRRPGRDAVDIIAEVLPAVIREFPWPKSMRWGEASREPGSLRWVRPLKSILCIFGPETEEAEIVDFEIDGLRSGNVTRGHRFLSPDPFAVKRFDDYVAKLEAAHVVLDGERRKAIIESDARNTAFAQGFELVEDEGLLEEVGNLVEWPVVIMGTFDREFLALPDEVTRLTIRENQKCFVVREGTALANRFLLVSNIVPSDGGVEIARGNGKVVRARLSDAKFFWESDLQIARSPGGFDRWVANLDQVTFHARLGSQGERIGRIVNLARTIAPLVGADAVSSARAARLAKADLQSAMVFEFPELQGRMGRLYAEAAGEETAVAIAIEEHYSPLGPSDRVPAAPTSVAVALADKLDTLLGFWSIDEKPTGSKDPYALRRAALGVIRLVLENGLRLNLLKLFAHGLDAHGGNGSASTDLLAFFHDRLKVFLRDSGVRHDLIDAVVDATADDLLLVTRKIRALQSLIESADGANLLAGYKRAANILAAEERKSTRIGAQVQPDRLVVAEENALHAAMLDAEAQAGEALAGEDFEAAMAALARLRAPLDAFFETVLVNDPDETIRANRLALLDRMRAATARVADFSRISG